MMRKCSECGKKLGFFEGYRHPVEGKKKCVCGKCWDKLEKSEDRYCSFIMNEFKRNIKKLKKKEK